KRHQTSAPFPRSVANEIFVIAIFLDSDCLLCDYAPQAAQSSPSFGVLNSTGRLALSMLLSAIYRLPRHGPTQGSNHVNSQSRTSLEAAFRTFSVDLHGWPGFGHMRQRCTDSQHG